MSLREAPPDLPLPEDLIIEGDPNLTGLHGAEASATVSEGQPAAEHPESARYEATLARGERGNGHHEEPPFTGFVAYNHIDADFLRKVLVAVKSGGDTSILADEAARLLRVTDQQVKAWQDSQRTDK